METMGMLPHQKEGKQKRWKLVEAEDGNEEFKSCLMLTTVMVKVMKTSSR